MRQYSLDDLNKMRRAILAKLDGIPAGCGIEAEYLAKTHNAVVAEEQLRTAVLANISPDDFENEAST